jgi:hypothetical protein
MLATSCAPLGIGKEPIGASTWTVVPEPAAGDVVCEGDAVGEDAARAAVGEGDLAGFTLVIPALHAARDRPAVQEATVMAMKRYVFIKCLSVSLAAPSSN